MSRKFIVAVAAVAALGTLIATDASARFGGGGGHVGGGHASFSRASFHPARINAGRTMSRTIHTNRVTTFSRVNRPNLHRPNFRHFHYAHHHHGHHWWWWCRHHHYRCGGWYGGVDGDYAPVEAAVATQPFAATPVAAVCNNDCDYFLKDEPGCYMAKRAFSTPRGDELRCVKICEEPDNAQAPK
jgi:hypothetical protein